ncbi:TonB-dependent receptor [Pedobacter nutrimenti]|uniref:TonB-dependent receptor n=1 Tax=Pedobacter nutrimenti TaxID=1241337 RepID=UPI0021D37861|nr:TonB-dependent receptor [Pedobacter nutrimenti]
MILKSQSRTGLKIRGLVVDKKNQPIEFATVLSEELSFTGYTNDHGIFELNIDLTRFKSFDLSVKMIGKKGLDTVIILKPGLQELTFSLPDLNFSLKEVQVNEVRKAKSSNSSIVFDRQAIEQVQAFSLGDILNNLPGKKIAPPNLQNPGNITLRSEASGAHALNNALGTAIILDEIQLSNNANMQNRNVGKFGLAGSLLDSRSYGGFDVTFGGIDLREIPADNIESIEVISGIAPAKYGDLTDGAIIINRQAGKTAYQFSSRINAGSSNFSLSKGYILGKKSGAVNVSLNYLFSEQDPSDPIKSYKRISTGLMWSSYLFKNFKNTVSLDYNTRLDDVKLDPDVGREYMTYAKSRNFSVSNRASLSFENEFFKSLSFSFGYSKGYQETYNQSYINNAPKPIADKDTIGLYEGYYIPGSYTAVEHLLGKPSNLNSNLSLNTELRTGKLIHQLSVGSNIYYAGNNGQGVIVDPEKPRWANQGYQNERPYDYESLPSIFNYGLYVEDHFKLNVLNKELQVNAGLRYDVQNNRGDFQPRVNLKYGISSRININAAFGTSTKAPALAHRYPAPVYFDLPVLNAYNGYTIESVYLVYTDKIVPDNSHLKPSKSSQVEVGLSYKDDFISSSFFAYFKKNSDGFGTLTNFRTYITPVFNYVYHKGQRPEYYPNGEYKDWIASYYTPNNSLSSNNYGAEWFISTKKIKTIETSFNLTTTFSYSSSKNASETIQQAAANYISNSYKAWFGVYPSARTEDYSISSKLTTTTHIPKLGFVVNFLADIFWVKQQRVLKMGYLPIAYLDRQLKRYEISEFNPDNTDYNYLALSSSANSKTTQPFVYANLSIRVAKEISKFIRMSVNAYNVFNIRNRYYNPNSNSVINYTYPVSVGAELSIKF